MSDVMQLARVRQKELTKTIAKQEAEIGKIREEIETLDMFIRLGDGLIHHAYPETVQTTNSGIEDHDETQSASDSSAPIVMPMRHTQSAY